MRHPVIDVSTLYEGDGRARRDVATALGAAAHLYGFFYVTGHRVPSVLMDRLIIHAKNFFRLPFETKMRWYIGNSKHHRGYVPEGEEVLYGGTHDRKEAFDLALDLPDDDVDVKIGTPMLGPNVWPDQAGFREDVGAYYTAVLSLGRVLFRGFALALNLSESYFDPLVTKPPSQLRLIHYPHEPDAVDAPGIGAHTDYECFTILLATAPGLQVMNRSGEWIEAPPSEGAFVVTIGDMMEVWTNGAFTATSHRVRRVSEERYSFPFFCACDYHTLVEPLPAFVSTDRPSRYSSISAGAHLFAQTAKTFRYLRGAGDVQSA
jgi:isopenicillin N synthase-like dioxygenase